MDTLRNRKVQHKVQDKTPEFCRKNESAERIFTENNYNAEEKTNISTPHDEGEVVKKEYEAENFSTEQKIIGRVNFQLDIISISLLICGLVTRMYKLEKPLNIV